VKSILLFLLLLPVGCRPTPALKTRDLFSVQAATPDGATFDLSMLKNRKAFVMVFLAPDCPFSQRYISTLNILSGQFHADGVEFLGVVAGQWFNDTEVRQFTETYRVSFPILLDRDFRLTDALGATVTPEAFALDSRGEILYRGAIDNGSTDLGQHRTIITEHYLRDALTSHLKGRNPTTRETPAAGCFIERRG
jgi:thiol-disulfide isomerase/thioredoxin